MLCRKRMKIAVIVLLASVLTLSVPGCSLNNPENTGIPVNTEFGKMLGYVPAAFLDKQDIWYSNPGALRTLYGLPKLESIDDLKPMDQPSSREYLEKLFEIPTLQEYAFKRSIKPLIGWDWAQIDQGVFNENPSAWGFSVVKGEFDEALIGRSLTQQGYTTSKYGAYTHYDINADLGFTLQTELGKYVLSDLNRIAVLDDTLVVAPSTEIMTGLLDAASKTLTSISDLPAARAIAESLGEVQGAVLINPDRVFVIDSKEKPSFDLPAAEKWGKLHQYSLVGIGHQDNGTERYWITSLYYNDKKAAAADRSELASRFQSYSFNSNNSLFPQDVIRLLTEDFQIDQLVVKEYPGGSILTIKCKYLSESRTRKLFLFIVPWRDLLFLAPDPAPYLIKNLE
jgi:hypothetical protein